MAKVASRLRVQDVGGVTRVEFVDKNILDEANIQQIGEELVKLADAGPRPGSSYASRAWTTSPPRRSACSSTFTTG